MAFARQLLGCESQSVAISLQNERDGYVAQLWSDKCTCNKVVVILKQNCKKGCFPVIYLPVPVEAGVEAVLSDALYKAGSQCELQQAA